MKKFLRQAAWFMASIGLAATIRGAETAPTPPPAAPPAASLGAANPAVAPDDVYLFAFFRGGSQDGLHLATSADGLHWEALNGDKSYLTPQVGAQKLMRDPSLFRGPDGTFHLVWTDAWMGKSIGYASSKDLLHWSEQQEIPVMANENARESWAPEIRYNAAKSEYLIYWSSSTGNQDFKTYAATTKDFKSFTPAKVLYAPGYSQIDASILEDNGKFLLFHKHGGQGISFATADNLDGPYGESAPQFAEASGDQWEGAWPTKVGGDYIVYVDHYRNRDRMGVWRSRDLKQWENITAQTTGLFDIRHGSVIKVPAAVVTALKAAAVSTAPAAPAVAPPAPAVPVVPAAPTVPAAPAAAGNSTAAASPASAPGGKEIYVIVHGAWGGGYAFKQLDDLLTADGNKVYRPTLTGQGEKVHLASPEIDLTTHINDIANVILWENLHDVVLVGHSYGGMVVTGVADRVPERLKRIVYVDAFLPVDGESLNTAGGGGGRGRGAVNGFVSLNNNSADRPVPHEVPQSAKTLSETLSLKNQEAVKKIPTVYILTVDAGRPAEQDTFYRFYQRAQARGWTMRTMEGDHNVHLSHPQELRDLLEKTPGTPEAAEK